MKRAAISGVLVAVIALGAGAYALVAPGARASAQPGVTAPTVYTQTMTATGAKQGVLAAVPVTGISHEVVVPRDPATGQATGRRQHQPISMTLQWGPTTPKYIGALVTNENFTSVLIALLRNNVKVATVKLTNAHLVDYAESDQNVQLQFTYQKITWTWISGGISASDDWSAPLT